MNFTFLDLDKKIFLILNGIHNHFFDAVMSYLNSAWLWIPLSLFICYILIKNFNLKSKKSLFFNILIILLFAFLQFQICVKLIPSFFDDMVHRIRPCYDEYISMFINYDESYERSRFGFFAAKACLAFSIATFLYLSLWDKYKLLKIAFIIIAILISYSRIYLGLHYPANILVSAITGVLIGFVSYPIFFYVKNSVSAA